MSKKTPKWVHKVYDLQTKFLLAEKGNPIPSQRDIWVYCWEKSLPFWIEFIDRNFVLKK